MNFKYILLMGLLLIPQSSVVASPVGFGSSSLAFPQNQLFFRNIAIETVNPISRRARFHARKERDIFKRLNLSPSQVSRMQSIRQKYKPRMNQGQESVRQARQKLKNLMFGNANAQQIRSQHNRLQTLENQLEDLRLNSLLEMRDVLNPSQRQKLAQMMVEKGAFRPLR